MIQDIAPKKYKIGYEAKRKFSEKDFVLLYVQNKVLCKVTDGKVEFPTVEQVKKGFRLSGEGFQYLFQIEDCAFYTNLRWVGTELEEFHLEPIQIFRQAMPKWLSFAGVSGYQIVSWYMSKKFCSVCGGKMVHSKLERAMQCTNCGRTEYPTIAPSVIVAVTNKNRLLLTKYAASHSKYANYALNAGYSEIGETLEDTVRREIMEEVGLKVKNITYYKSQPWSFSGALLVGFFCEVEGEDTIHMDPNELSEATWFEREAIPVEDNLISLTYEMIDLFKRGKDPFSNK